MLALLLVAASLGLSDFAASAGSGQGGDRGECLSGIIFVGAGAGLAAGIL